MARKKGEKSGNIISFFFNINYLAKKVFRKKYNVTQYKRIMNLTEQEFLERDLNRRMLARARQKKFYQKHRERILQMRRAARIAYRQTMVAIQPQRYQRRPRVIIQNQFIPSDDIILTQDKIIELLKTQERVEGSENTYISSIKRYFDPIKLFRIV